MSTEKGLVDHWDPKGGPGSNVLWKSEELAGRSSPIVLRGKLYTIVRDKPGTADEGEKVVCADAATGKVIWEHRFNVSLTEVPPERVGWSNVVGDPETGRIYAQGVSGYFCCLDGETGKVIWDRDLAEEFGTISTFGGRTNTPVVFEDTVLISAVLVDWGDSEKWSGFARPAHRFMAFDKATGELRWINGTSISPYDTNYGTPTLGGLGGQQAARLRIRRRRRLVAPAAHRPADLAPHLLASRREYLAARHAPMAKSMSDTPRKTTSARRWAPSPPSTAP